LYRTYGFWAVAYTIVYAPEIATGIGIGMAAAIVG
jgi:hypothetical protein